MSSVVPSQHIAPRWRSALAVIGLGAAIVDGALYLGFAAYAILIGGFEATFRPLLFWYRIGVWLGALAILASGLGTGRMRKWGLIVGIVVFVFWLVRGHR